MKILYGRGFDDRQKIDGFIHPSRSRFISPFKMQGMNEAVELITLARAEGWVVAVYGDYDADGVCAATIMYRALKDFGIEPVVYIPERREGYGLNRAAIDEIFDEYFPQLFITVDCGISGADEVDYIKEQGAEVIVTDHHELSGRIPDCICINPKFNDGYVYDNLCGAGVALKVGCALNGDDALKYLDFAAIATVADSVPLTGENRDIVYEGLKLINNSPRNCYSYFLAKNESAVTSQTLAFSVAPKINAAGRMGDAHSALVLFNETDESAIFDLAAKLTSYNQERQKFCDELYLSAKRKLKDRGAYGRVIMLSDDSWNSGFVGIVAARLADEYSRPALLFVRHGDMLKGSARSVENVNIFEALKACEDLIDEFGGHAQAAGINIKAENFDKLEEALNGYLLSNYTAEDFEPTLYISGKLTAPYSARFAKELELLEPFGVGNRRPLFETEEGALEVRPVKPLSPHISVKSANIELMYFGGGRYSYLMQSHAPKRYVFEYNVSKFRGREYVKGFIRDVVIDRNAAQSAEEEIAVNNVLNLAHPAIDCEILRKSSGEIDEIMSGGAGYGTVYIAHEYDTLSRYKNAGGFPVELFVLSSGNLADCILVSPVYNADLSGFKRVVFLDAPPSGVRIASLAAKEAVICTDVCGYNFLKQLPCGREELLKIFSELSAKAPSLNGADSGEIALKNEFSLAPRNIAFALEVFRQLSLISYDGGKIVVYRGVRTDLKNSELYNIVSNLNG